MAPELEKYYSERFELTGSKGWQDLVEDIDIMLSSTDTLSGVETQEQLWFRKGEVSMMNWIKSLRDTSKTVYDELKEVESNG